MCLDISRPQNGKCMPKYVSHFVNTRAEYKYCDKGKGKDIPVTGRGGP
jgi:hypothetical protein